MTGFLEMLAALRRYEGFQFHFSSEVSLCDTSTTGSLTSLLSCDNWLFYLSSGLELTVWTGITSVHTSVSDISIFVLLELCIDCWQYVEVTLLLSWSCISILKWCCQRQKHGECKRTFSLCLQVSSMKRLRKWLNQVVFLNVRLWMVFVFILLLIFAVIIISIVACAGRFYDKCFLQLLMMNDAQIDKADISRWCTGLMLECTAHALSTKTISQV